MALRRLAPFAAALLALVSCRESASDPKLVVHFVNDLHGHLAPFTRPDGDEEVGGVARLVTLVEARRREARSAGADSIFLVAGDVLQGTAMASVFFGKPDFEVLNRLRVDAMVVGNHEFDFGQGVLAERIAQARFPILAANVLRADGTPFLPGSASLTTSRNGLEVAVLGLVTPSTATTTFAPNVAGLSFEDPVAVARREVPLVAAASDVTIVLSHCGLAVDRELAQIPGVDLVVGGHDQILLDPPLTETVPIVQAGEWGEYLGEVALTGDGRWLGGTYLHVTSATEPDPEIHMRVEFLRALLAESLGQTIAVAASDLVGGDAARVGETNLGDLVADAVREATGSEVALVNAGALRETIPAGEITTEDVLDAMPYDNQLVLLDLSGREIETVLEHSLASRSVEEGGFLQVSGLEVTFDEAGIVDLSVGGLPLDRSRRYRVVTSDFLSQGGDGYEMLSGQPVIDSGHMLSDVVMRRLQALGTIEAETDGRLRLPERRPPG